MLATLLGSWGGSVFAPVRSCVQLYSGILLVPFATKAPPRCTGTPPPEFALVLINDRRLRNHGQLSSPKFLLLFGELLRRARNRVLIFGSLKDKGCRPKIIFPKTKYLK
jgi:hypothetical protein